MTCGRFKELMTASLDGELSTTDLAKLREHLSKCDSCRREFEEMKRVTELIGRIDLPKPPEEDMMRYWPSVYARIERGMGWSLLLVGAVIWIAYGVYAFITDPTTEALVKFLIALPVVGVLVLLISVVRERYHVSKTERYGEVER